VSAREPAETDVRVTRIMVSSFSFTDLLQALVSSGDDTEETDDGSSGGFTGVRIEPRPSLDVETDEIVVKLSPGGEADVSIQFTNNGTGPGNEDEN
jgi:hypothetical protein